MLPEDILNVPAPAAAEAVADTILRQEDIPTVVAVVTTKQQYRKKKVFFL